MNDYEHLIALLEKSARIVALTGAGISTSAGIPDFRGPGGLYSRRDIDPELLFDINHFLQHPDYFYRNIASFWQTCANTAPSTAHFFLAALEQKGKLETIITQNIDGLHRKAGNSRIIELHGGFDYFVCPGCRARYKAQGPVLDTALGGMVPYCEACTGPLKPDVVFFGEAVPAMDEAIKLAGRADLFIVIGSSLLVYPAASLPQYARCPKVIINRGSIPDHLRFDLLFDDDIDKVIDRLSE